MTDSKFRIVRADRAAGGKEECQVGETVYRCARHDYGCSSEDTRWTGIRHISVTRKSDGDYPFFTIPVEDLERLS